jgi:hypothetical protein
MCTVNFKSVGDVDDDGYYDLQWVPALMVPMHLSLIGRPFVLHNLISA